VPLGSLLPPGPPFKANVTATQVVLEFARRLQAGAPLRRPSRFPPGSALIPGGDPQWKMDPPLLLPD